MQSPQIIYDLLAIGAGPTGLACAIEAKRAGLRPFVIDKGCLCNSIFHYPTNMIFFTTPERMEIGDLPMTVPEGKPTRVEALKYYRRAVEHYALDSASTRQSKRSLAKTAPSSSAPRDANGESPHSIARKKSFSPPATTIARIC